MSGVVIIGGGQAGAQAAQSLRQGGYDGAITMLCAEPVPPYQRPPLSKKYLSGEMGLDRVVFRPLEAWADERVDVRLGETATALDRGAGTVTTDKGAYPYAQLIIATGSRVRALPIHGADLEGVHVLRTTQDVDGLRAGFAPGKRLVIVGGGYIGLEVAAVAAKAGLQVTLLEAMERVLARVTAPAVSDFYEGVHRAEGVDIRTGVVAGAIEGAGTVEAVVLKDGARIEADLVLIAVGILPNQELASEASLACGNGIAVDEDARTSDPSIFAIGDCAERPLVHYGRRGRLESVHNAIEQAKLAAAAILGQPRPALEAPWFWSDQYDLKLQTAGLFTGHDATVLRGDPATRRFALFYLKDGRLLAVDAINSPAEFLASKALIARGARLAPEILADTSTPMKQIAAMATD
jgi:3-phenylpropionate/trans-cinnamate dioxygenase ferredoxin reductase component